MVARVRRPRPRAPRTPPTAPPRARRARRAAHVLGEQHLVAMVAEHVVQLVTRLREARRTVAEQIERLSTTASAAYRRRRPALRTRLQAPRVGCRPQPVALPAPAARLVFHEAPSTSFAGPEARGVNVGEPRNDASDSRAGRAASPAVRRSVRARAGASISSSTRRSRPRACSGSATTSRSDRARRRPRARPRRPGSAPRCRAPCPVAAELAEPAPQRHRGRRIEQRSERREQAPQAPHLRAQLVHRVGLVGDGGGLELRHPLADRPRRRERRGARVGVGARMGSTSMSAMRSCYGRAAASARFADHHRDVAPGARLVRRVAGVRGRDPRPELGLLLGRRGLARTARRSSRRSITASGWATRFRYHAGCRSAPPLDATSTTRSGSTIGAERITVRGSPLRRPVMCTSTVVMPARRHPRRPRVTRITQRWNPESALIRRSPMIPPPDAMTRAYVPHGAARCHRGLALARPPRQDGAVDGRRRAPRPPAGARAGRAALARPGLPALARGARARRAVPAQGHAARRDRRRDVGRPHPVRPRTPGSRRCRRCTASARSSR